MYKLASMFGYGYAISTKATFPLPKVEFVGD
jgi:hypothetical protein